MKKAMIIDPVATNRSNLVHQLESIESFDLVQYSSMSEAQRHLTSSFQGPIFVSLGEGLTPLTDFVHFLRVLNQDASVITLATNVTLTEMRCLVELGVDQILIRPFNSIQLKEKITAAEKFRAQVIQENLSLGPSYKNKFEADVKMFTDKFCKVYLGGWLREDCKLPDIQPLGKDGTLFVDCDRLWGMNSVGIRLWTLWIKSLSEKGIIRFEFENLRPNFLQQARVLSSMLPSNSAVNSFYLRYWNEDNEKEVELKISRGKHFATDRMRIPKFHTEMVDGKSLRFELDDTPEKLLTFHKGTIEIV